MIPYRSIQHSKYEINNNIRDWIVIIETSCIHFLETLNSKKNNNILDRLSTNVYTFSQCCGHYVDIIGVL